MGIGQHRKEWHNQYAVPQSFMINRLEIERF
jgi:hypothetical protein